MRSRLLLCLGIRLWPLQTYRWHERGTRSKRAASPLPSGDCLTTLWRGRSVPVPGRRAAGDAFVRCSSSRGLTAHRSGMVPPDGRVGAVELCLAGRMESDTVRLTYRGGVRGVSMLAQMLEEQGVSVRYALPRETRDMTEAAAIVVVAVSVTGDIDDIAAVVQRFSQKFGSDAQIEGLPEPKRSVEERLAAVDQLLADGKITPEEHAQQRTRILNEL